MITSATSARSTTSVTLIRHTARLPDLGRAWYPLAVFQREARRMMLLHSFCL